jgi:hypothetical protein
MRFQLFRKPRTKRLSDERTLFYHEDDYCQVELSPKENLGLFQKESEEINELADKSFDGYGYTDIYVRNDNRLPLKERRIKPLELEHVISTVQLERAAKVITGYGETYRETRKDAVGFGKNYSAIYFDFKDDVVNHIWMTNHFSMDREKLVYCLLMIGQKWDLLLMDWNRKVPVDLSDKNAIEQYLQR